MAVFSIDELTGSVQKSNYQWTKVPLLTAHEVKIVEAEIGPSKFGGQIMKLVFEYQADYYSGHHISSIIAYTFGNGKVNQKFLDFLGLFFDLSDPLLAVDTDDLIGKRCRIEVEDQENKKFQKVSKYLPLATVK